MRKHSSEELLNLATDRRDALHMLEACGFPEQDRRPTYGDMARAIELLSICSGLYPEWCSAGWGPDAICDGFDPTQDGKVGTKELADLRAGRIPEGGAQWTVGVHRGACEGMILTVHRRYDDGSPDGVKQIDVCSLKTTETGRTTWATLYRIAEEVGARLNGVYGR